MKDKISFLYLMLIPTLTLGISFGVTIYPLCVLLILLRLVTTSKDTAGFFLLMFGGPLGGSFRLMYPSIPLYGVLLALFGAFLARGWLRSFLADKRSSIKYMFAVFAVFFVSYIFAEHTEYANQKIFQIIYHGSLMFWGFYVYQKSTQMRNEDLVILILLSSITYVVFLVNYYNFSPGSIFDYNWLRTSLHAQVYLDQSETILSYHSVGMTALMGISLLASKEKLDIIPFTIYSCTAFQLIMMSGARQAIIGFVIILFLRFAFFNKGSKKVLMFLFGVVAVFILYKLISSSGSESLEKMSETGGGGRDLIMLEAIRLIIEYPLFGVGLGGFAIHAAFLEVAWPHNFFLEILCETGCVGTLILLIIVLTYIGKNKIDLRYLTATNCYYYLFATALAIRTMVSGDLCESVELFSLLFAVSGVRLTKNKIIYARYKCDYST